ncbi:MAG TPA: hypothetical protein VJA82_08405 [Sediminibacterium sp.]|uniref:hypothetical protein n=1 Tax=Sediminibacterium sp. TaxID=1917865 RepID=UPI0008C2705F|nr:hypothetical protein [Sediminibacterium sp.]MBT9484597.1 hypothetical protein [Sediminibacterium sp.]OHC84794.1 MAG: hypothetical protein A2472_14020 [Sphingobacteriia bacterium RIFOXYC2_FULL_35_18]OHC88165.1 MAG: hypothetical protein A2546_00790 [Sphingobacteriia bacterium RIFOXYD2_FULL_35_12]HLD53311.1 hypothetical protein [Sediminibacterium sp.]
MTGDNTIKNFEDELTGEQALILQNKIHQEKKVFNYGWILYLFLALVGPFLPPKIPSFKDTNTNYFPSVLFHFLFWGSFYLFSLRDLFRLNKDFKKGIKLNTTARVLKKRISKSLTSTKYSLKLYVGNNEKMNFEVSQKLFDKIEENEHVLISYTPHSKTVLEVEKI